ncbi:tripartite tricarboxylate transporter substrate binding protein [Rhodovarius crocodyli]|uniref:Tripartite tricarboxylate transporter substrate binding protein n=1 Tax=Rhodovarius crocodyli TaxID=1979269 RepID=A0A437ME03_9PROT|nr:tripartite tricarboxylate transporter substrate-binding protein [Rhodovarius crocodyli]RVT95878.1 tripartite tricarboxylate transporter substrate binding protein [Rhodovarius crocodyli]
MTITRRGALALPLLMPALAQAQRFTAQRPVRMVVPYTPGGVSDITARLIADPLSATWSQPVAVENRAGADGIIGTEVVARSAPDGHTLSLVSVGHPVNAAFYRLPYDTMADFTFLSLTTRTPLVLCAARGFEAGTPAELVALAKRRGAGAVTFAGTGGVVRLAPVLFGSLTGTELTYVPYRGSTQAHPDLIAGRVDIMFDTVPAALPHIQSGALKAMATTGAARSPQLPDVPTMAEALLPGFEASTWGMVMGPGNMNEDLASAQSRDVAAALRMPAVVERHRVLGAEIVSSTPAETRDFVRAEMTKWGETARRAGIEPQALR